MRSPRPAARIMAANPVPAFSESVANFQLRSVDLPPVKQRQQGIELAVAFARLAQVIRHQRYVLEIAALAIAIIQARKYSQDLEVALHAHPLEIAVKIRKACCNRQLEFARLLPIADQPVQYAFFVPADVCILEQGYEIVSNGAIHCILKIENSRTGRRYHQVARVVVTV